MEGFGISSIAKDISAIIDARRSYSRVHSVDTFKNSEIRSNQRSIENFLNSFLMKAGFDFDKFDDILKQNQAELSRISEEQKADAIKHSSLVKDTLRHGVNNRLNAIEHLTKIAFAPKYELLNVPFLIWWTQGIDFPDIHYEAANSWAKFKLETTKEFTEEMSFYFLWENPSDKYAVINVDGYLVTHGFCTAHADRGYWPTSYNEISLGLIANLYLWEWWNQPPTQIFWQEDQTLSLLSLLASSTPLTESNKLKTVFRGCDLNYNLFSIPPKSTAVFEVSLMVWSIFDNTGGFNPSGKVQADLQSGDFEVMCPGVLITVLS